MSRTGQLTVQSVGVTKLVATENTNPADPHPLGGWTIAIQSPDQPTAPTSLKITGKRLDSGETATPVYRIDVPATQWGLPFSTPPAPKPPCPRWRPVASPPPATTFLSVCSSRRDNPSGPPPDRSPCPRLGSLHRQNPSTGQQITDIYVKAGVNAVSTSSAKVNLATLTAPAAGTTIGQVTACPAKGTNQCDAKADPVANGLDQAPLKIQLADMNNNVLKITDAAYGRIYYRDENDDLLTGLIPADGTSYLRVSPYAGAFPNDGSEDNSDTCTGRCSSSAGRVRLRLHHLHRRTGGHRPRRRLPQEQRPRHR